MPTYPKLALLASLLACSGCHSVNQPASASFASVVISNRSIEEVRRTTALVFNQAGYQTAPLAPGDFAFEKDGSPMSQFAHGGWLEDSRVRERVRTQVVPLGDGTWRLQCTASMVRDPGDPRFEEEI